MRSWPPLWESFQKLASPAQRTWAEGCSRSSVQSYLPWETASQGLTLHNPIPPISHCISCHMGWLRVQKPLLLSSVLSLIFQVRSY